MSSELSGQGFRLAYRRQRPNVIGCFRLSPVPFCYELLRAEQSGNRKVIWSLALASAVPDAMHSPRNSYKELVSELPNPGTGGTSDIRSTERALEWQEAFLRIAPSYCTELCIRRGPTLVAETRFARNVASWFLRQLGWKDCAPSIALNELLSSATRAQQEHSRTILSPWLLESFLIDNDEQELKAIATLKLATLAIAVFWNDSPLADRVSSCPSVSDNDEMHRIVLFMASCIYNPLNWTFVPPDERLVQ